MVEDLALPTNKWRVQRAVLTPREATGPDGGSSVLTDSIVVLVRATGPKPRP